MFASISSGISEFFTDAIPGFSVGCFLKGVVEGLAIGLGALLVIAALPAELAIVAALGLIALGIYGAVKLAEAWPNMNGAQKSEALGQITGGVIAGKLGPGFIPPPEMPFPTFGMAQMSNGQTILVPATVTVAPATAGAVSGAAAGGAAMMAASSGGGGGDGGDDDRESRRKTPLTNKEAAAEAKKLGFDKKVNDPPFDSHGKAVFTDGKNYITPDRDVHSGGTWKMFDRSGNRLGTYDEQLNRIGP